jgi:hypothetical protein
VKLKTLDSGAGVGPHGVIISWLPSGTVEVDDSDTEAVAWYRQAAKDGRFEIIEDAPKSEADELDALREQAAKIGVKVDKRWGVDRLREEIASASEVAK